jgi:hypothetical protein
VELRDKCYITQGNNTIMLELIAFSHLALKCHIATLVRLACFDSIQQSEALVIEQKKGTVRAITKYGILQNTEMSKLR